MAYFRHMSFATPSMTQGSDKTAISTGNGVIDYRNGFSLPFGARETQSVCMLAGPVKPTKTDISVSDPQNNIEGSKRLISVSYSPCEKTVVDIKQVASRVAHEIAAQSRLQSQPAVCTPSTGADLAAAHTSLGSIEGHVHSVALNQKNIYEQLGSYNTRMASVSNSVRDTANQMKSMDSSVTQRLSELEAMRTELSAQRTRMDSMQTRMNEKLDGSHVALGEMRSSMNQNNARLMKLSEGVQSSLRNVENMHEGLQDHKSQISNLKHLQIDNQRSVTRVNSLLHDKTTEIGSMQEGLANHTVHINSLAKGVTAHDTKIAEMHVGLCNHTSHIGEMSTGLQNHTEHLRQMKDGMMNHTSHISEIRSQGVKQAPQNIDALLLDINTIKARVDGWDRNVVTRSESRDCTARQLSDILRKRTM